MEAWIKVYYDLSDHPKVYDLADRLKIEQFAAVGLAVSLWIWAIIHAPNGDLSRFPDTAIARACHWHKPAAGLVKALQECGFLDDHQIHDWDEYASALMDAVEVKKEKTRKRVEAYRARKAVTEALQQDENGEDCNADCNATCNAGVTLPVTPDSVTCNADVTPCNALRTRTRTRTRINSNTHESIPQEADARARAHARDGWYDPEDPDSADTAWRDSPLVRRAIAQRILDYVRSHHDLGSSHVVTEGGQVGNELHRALTAAMEAGVSPAQCQDIGMRSGKAWIWEGRLKAAAIAGGADVPEKWRDQVNEIREDLEEAEIDD